MNNNHDRWYICEDCTFVFQTHSKFSTKKTKPYCPNCGENIFMSRYHADRTNRQTSYIKWTDEEKELLEQCRQGKIMVHQAAIMMGRSISSVSSKLKRMKKVEH